MSPDQFYDYAEPVPEAGCWIWTKPRGGPGYGTAWINGKNVSAHRYSWELANGRPIPAGMCVLHKCDTPSCVNPDHLFLGTNLDNTKDATAKGRRWNLRMTTCKNGHSLAPENRKFKKGGGSQCLICASKTDRESRERRRLKKASIRSNQRGEE